MQEFSNATNMLVTVVVDVMQFCIYKGRFQQVDGWLQQLDLSKGV